MTNNPAEAMSPEQRESLRQDVAAWVRSEAFDVYFTELHIPLSRLGLILLASLFYPGRAKPSAVLDGARMTGIGTPSLKRRYHSLAGEGRIVLAGVWMANAALTRGEMDFVPALLVASANGSAESDAHMQGTLEKLAELNERPASSHEEQIIQAMLDDELYRTHRVRRLPLSFTENEPVFLFDTLLHRSTMAGDGLAEMPFVACLVHPEMRPSILPLPAALVARHIGE